MMRTITLNWQGPIRMKDLETNNKIYDDLNKTGVYLWCAKQYDKYVIVYVGKANNIATRLCQEVGTINNGLSTLFNITDDSENWTDENLDCKYLPNYSNWDDDAKALAETNKEHLYIFYSAIEINDETPDLNMQVEGAIQIHLWRKTETRKYLITGVSSWNLRNAIIHNHFPADITIIGLDRTIETPD